MQTIWAQIWSILEHAGLSRILLLERRAYPRSKDVQNEWIKGRVKAVVLHAQIASKGWAFISVLGISCHFIIWPEHRLKRGKPDRSFIARHKTWSHPLRKVGKWILRYSIGIITDKICVCCILTNTPKNPCCSFFPLTALVKIGCCASRSKRTDYNEHFPPWVTF